LRLKWADSVDFGSIPADEVEIGMRALADTSTSREAHIIRPVEARLDNLVLYIPKERTIMS